MLTRFHRCRPCHRYPPPPHKLKQSLMEICDFYSNSLTGHDASVQPTESEPAFFFRAYTDIDTPSPLCQPPVSLASSLPVISQALLSSPPPEDPPAACIWRDARILLAPPPPHCEPCALSPLLSMLPSGIMNSGAFALPVLSNLIFMILCLQF